MAKLRGSISGGRGLADDEAVVGALLGNIRAGQDLDMAIRAFQTAKGLPADGKVDGFGRTWQLMLDAAGQQFAEALRVFPDTGRAYLSYGWSGAVRPPVDSMAIDAGLAENAVRLVERLAQSHGLAATIDGADWTDDGRAQVRLVLRDVDWLDGKGRVSGSTMPAAAAGAIRQITMSFGAMDGSRVPVLTGTQRFDTVARIKHVSESMRAKYQLTPLVSDDRAGNRILAALVDMMARVPRLSASEQHEFVALRGILRRSANANHTRLASEVADRLNGFVTGFDEGVSRRPRTMENACSSEFMDDWAARSKLDALANEMRDLEYYITSTMESIKNLKAKELDDNLPDIFTLPNLAAGSRRPLDAMVRYLVDELAQMITKELQKEANRRGEARHGHLELLHGRAHEILVRIEENNRKREEAENILDKTRASLAACRQSVKAVVTAITR
ncbi:MAG: peptidoglycan-binding protein [Alphaproteobacteria bacterium]|nr:peptidoglycan-binding protein [Alphaproteobacteria bacterium]